MPSAIPAEAAARLPKARMIDPRGHRFGAGRLSAPADRRVRHRTRRGWSPSPCSRSAISAAFGLRYSIYGAIWRRIVKVAHLGPVEPEHEYPPRFAQVLGSVALTLSLIAFILGAPTLGWVFALAVAGLQTLLAVDRLLPRLPPVLPALVGAGSRHPDLDPRRQLGQHAGRGADLATSRSGSGGRSGIARRLA